MSELVNCGCGGEGQILHPSYANCIVVMCGKCGIKTPYMNTEAEAVEAWNTAMGCKWLPNPQKIAEPELTAKVLPIDNGRVFKCANCGQYFHRTSWSAPVRYCSSCGAKLDWSGNE